MKKLSLVASMAIALSVSAPAQAGWFDSVVSWVDNNIVDPIETAVVTAVNWLDKEIITPTGQVLKTVEEYAAYIEVVEDTMTNTGYSSSGGIGYSAPTEPAAASGVLNVATFNVHGFPQVLEGISDSQATTLSSMINNWGWDIAAIQEDWVINGPLTSNLSNSTYPYRSNHYAGTMISFGDGLLTLSKHPMDKNKVIRRKWTNCSGTLEQFLKGEISSPDCATEKGFTISEVHVASDFVVHFYNLHANTGGVLNQSDLADMSSYISTYSAGFPVVIAGDWNMSLSGGNCTPLLATWIADNGFRLACQDLNSCDDAIDQVAFKGSEQYSFTAIGRTTHDDLGISDHRPRSAQLSWVNNNVAQPKVDSVLNVAFQGVHGRYFVSEGNGGSGQTVNANRGGIGSWEQFKLRAKTAVVNCIVNGDKVGVDSGTGYYWSAQSSGELDADRPWFGTWETFTIINHSDATGCLANGDTISLKSYHNKYVVAESDGKARANRSAIGSYERIKVVFY